MITRFSFSRRGIMGTIDQGPTKGKDIDIIETVISNMTPSLSHI
jgi:hypothetical protein